MFAFQRVKVLLAIAGLSLCLGAAQARDEPMMVPDRISVQDRPGVSQAALRVVMIRAAARRNWMVMSDAPGEIVLKQSRQGKHEATVKVSYNESTYQLIYVDSFNLNADPGRQRIHPTYNMWLRNLSSDIASEIGLIGLQ